MASKFREAKEETGKLRARKGHDMTWSCDKHAEPISFYCKPHKIYACDRCAIKEHRQKSCQLKDIEDIILETRRQLDDLQPVIEKTKKRLISLDSRIESSATSSRNHLQSVTDEVNAIYEEKLKRVSDREKEKIRLINEEADEEIRIINERRDRRIKECKEENQQQIISRDIQAKLLSEIKKIEITVREKMEDLKSKNQHSVKSMDNLDFKIERMNQNDETLVIECPQVIASFNEVLSSNVHLEIADYLDQIESEVQRVRFVEGEVGGEHYERIDGYIGKWKLVKSIDISSFADEPFVCGFISDDEICVLDGKNKTMFVTNLSTEHQEIATEGVSILSCVPVHNSFTVCTREVRSVWRHLMGDSLDRCITLYDRKWKVIADITIPRNTLSNKVYVDVDKDGMILAAQCDQSDIYVFSPADSKTVNTITLQGKKVLGRIHALSSGDIVVRTDGAEFTVISRSGEEKTVIHYDEWSNDTGMSFLIDCSVDKLTDTLYITYWDEEREICAVDQVSCYGGIQARRILEYKESDFLNCPCFVTPSGNLVTCADFDFLVYGKSFIV